MNQSLRQQEHRREHRSLLARPEKAVLAILAGVMPRRINPDHLTSLGALGMVMAGAAFAAASWHRAALIAVPFALAVNWFGDSLDGTLARTRRCPRPRYGYYVDHVLDTAGAIVVIGGLAVSGVATPATALIVLIAYLAVSAETYLATHAVGVFRLAYAGLGPTELRILIAVGTLAAYADPWVWIGGREYLLFDIGAWVATTGLAFTFVVSAVSRGAELYRAEPLPQHAPNVPGRATACGDPAPALDTTSRA